MFNYVPIVQIGQLVTAPNFMPEGFTIESDNQHTIKTQNFSLLHKLSIQDIL
jgi:hypothetical protein